jgi:toxin ParE1/3/4
MPRVLRKPLARADLLDIWNYVADDGPAKADASSILSTSIVRPSLAFRRWAAHAMSLVLPYAAFLLELRRHCVIFYREVSKGIEIVRILHGARDIEGIISSGA